MNKQVQCPICYFEFLAEEDSSGHCECPSCESILMLVAQHSGHDVVMTFEECVSEAHVLSEEAKNLDDASLEDEIAYEVTRMDFMKGTFGMFSEMDSVGYMAYDTRKKAEGVYILMHSKNHYGREQ